MLIKPTFAVIAALVLASASTAFAQSHRQTSQPQRRAESRSLPALTNPRNAGQAAQDCSSTYQGYRLCDWLRPSPWP
jgi:hypothetical protein